MTCSLPFNSNNLLNILTFCFIHNQYNVHMNGIRSKPMTSIKRKLEIKSKKSIRIFSPSLTVALVAFTLFTISTLSYLQVIKPVMAAPSFIISKTLNDDAAGHSRGWDPDGIRDGSWTISDTDVSPTKLVHVITSTDLNDDPNQAICDEIFQVKPGQFSITCQGIPGEGAPLRYIIIDVPTKVVTSSLSASSSSSDSSSSSPFTSLQAGK
jgi:hypothetical protein